MPSCFVDYRLSEADPEVREIIHKEKERQFKSLELFASENFTSRVVMEAVGSCLTNKYSEGLPDNGGNEYIDELETLCQKSALAAFHLDEKKWGVNVQLLSGCPANFQVDTAILNPHDRIMDLDLPHGGHLSHGFMTPKRRCLSIPSHEEDCRSCWCFSMMDMAHISGLVAAFVVGDPFKYCDIVTTTTHKSLGGPRGGMIFFKKDPVVGVDLESAINNAVFPGLQGGPHNHKIGGLAVCLKHAQSPEFKNYQEKVVSNCRAD
ncbi:hypothetical protein ACOSP7_008425 [Xanthoceras sorbifolium]